MTTTGAGYQIDDTVDGSDLVVTGPWTSAAAHALQDVRVDGLVLNYARGYCESSLDFLQPLPIKRITVLDHWLTDLSPLNRLGETLQQVSVSAAPSARLDLACASNLTTLLGTWRVIASTAARATAMERLIVLGYRHEDLGPIAHMTRLNALTLKDSRSLQSLDGVESLLHLAKLQVLWASTLTDTQSLRSCAGALRHLELEKVWRLGHLDDVSALADLTFLGASDCRAVKSLSPLAPLQGLERLFVWGDTKVMDNDLSPLLELPNLKELRMMSRPSYRPSVTEIQGRLPVV